MDITAWEAAYQRFETPAEEQRKFMRRLRGLGVHRWPREARVLEICCGRGNGLIAWQRLGFSHVVGVDLSSALIERSAHTTRCIVGDARRLPVRDASQDVTIVQGGLHHLLSMEALHAALAEMRRVLKPDGHAIVIEPWATPFLHFIHYVSDIRPLRAASNKLDAFAVMREHERVTYEAWLASPKPILAAIAANFEPVILRQRFGKLVLLGRPRSIART